MCICIVEYYEQAKTQIVFDTKSEQLIVDQHEGLYEMDFPAYDLKPVPVTKEMVAAIGAVPKEAYLGRDLLCVFENAEDIKKLAPDLEKVKKLDGLLLQVTAPTQTATYDCISRSFAPKLDVAEDPVCGSGHCHIIPYWSKKLAKTQLTAYQASARGGVLYCHLDGKRVILAGKAALYSQAEIYLPN